MAHDSWLVGALVYLAAGVIAVPLARLAGLSSIIGYLVAGILIGPGACGSSPARPTSCTSPSSASC